MHENDCDSNLSPVRPRTAWPCEVSDEEFMGGKVDPWTPPPPCEPKISLTQWTSDSETNLPKQNRKCNFCELCKHLPFLLFWDQGRTDPTTSSTSQTVAPRSSVKHHNNEICPSVHKCLSACLRPSSLSLSFSVLFELAHLLGMRSKCPKAFQRSSEINV